MKTWQKRLLVAAVPAIITGLIGWFAASARAKEPDLTGSVHFYPFEFPPYSQSRTEVMTAVKSVVRIEVVNNGKKIAEKMTATVPGAVMWKIDAEQGAVEETNKAAMQPLSDLAIGQRMIITAW